MTRTLYDYFRSSASFRVRIALNLKGLTYEALPVHLVRDGGEQHLPEYRQKNPQALVPTFQEGDFVLSQSLAILDYLDRAYPEPTLVPGSLDAQMQIRSFAYAICCDIHPLNNLRVLQYLSNTLSIGDDEKNAWYQHWIRLGFEALETRLAKTHTNEFAFGSQPTLADICLIPQVYNAYRFECGVSDFPHIEAIYAFAMETPPFAEASPEAAMVS